MSNSDCNRRALEIFDAVCDLHGPARSAALDASCGDDTILRARVEAFLDEDERENGPIRATSFGCGAGVLVDQMSGREPDPAPERVGPYRIVRELGRGGMGVVYEAEQEHPNRRVALKVIRVGLGSREARRRFEREVQVLGRLDHPCIAQIYAAGSAQIGGATLPYFAMELVEGLPLDRHITEYQLNTRQTIELVARVCDAVHHAHQREVIHRDLKPANILVRSGDTEAGLTATHTMLDEIGLPKVLDFGVARATEAEGQVTLQTHAGQIVGTLAYMSPEQLGDTPAAVDTRGDVYTIGVMLYELLAGRRPHELEGVHFAEAARLVREADPPRLGQLDPSCRGDIETIVAKAMEKDRERRYDSAAALGEDLRRFLRDEPILARPATAMYQLRKFARRNRTLVGGLVCTFAALVAGLLAVSVLLVKVSDQRDEAVLLRDKADDAAADALAARDEAREAEHRATDALKQASAVANFQGSMLDGLNITDTGRRTWEEFGRRLLEAAKTDADREAVRSALAGVAGPDLVRFIVDDAILAPAVVRLDDPRFRMSPAAGQRVRGALGNAYEMLGINEAAREQVERAIQLVRQMPGDNRDRMGDLELRLAFILLSMGRAEEALPHALLALDASQSPESPRHDSRWQLRITITHMYLLSGRLAEARDWSEQLIADLRRDNPEDLNLLESAQVKLAEAMIRAGDPEGGLEVLDSVMAARMARGLGNETGTALDEARVIAYTAVGRFDDAHQVMDSYMVKLRPRRGEDHPWTLDARLMLADLLLAEGAPERAAAEIEGVLSVERRTYPRDELRIADVQVRLVWPLLLTGRVTEAREAAEAGWREILAAYDPGSLRSIRALIARAQVRMAIGDPGGALDDSREAAAAAGALLGPRAAETLTAEQIEGAALAALGRTAEARAVLERVTARPWVPGVIRTQAEDLLESLPTDR